MTLSDTEVARIQGEACRRDLKRFIKTMWSMVEPTSPFIDGYHIDAIVDHLHNLKDIRNLMINIPPRASKSLIVAVLFPAWLWATQPNTRFIVSSYALQLSIRDSIKCRRLIESDLYKMYYGEQVRLTSDQNTKIRFDNSAGGFRLASSVEGATTGEGGEVIIADDPMSIQDSESKAARDSVVRWFTTVWANRLNDPATGCRVLVMQRCHVDDVAGYLLKNDVANNWTKLILPLEAGKSRYVSTRWVDKRTEGELLCPERIPPSEVSFLKAQLGSRAFNAQYNQNPAPASEQLFNTDLFKYYDIPPDGGLRIAAVDLAISQTGDYTVFAIADIHRDGNIYLVHLHRERMHGPKIIPTMKALHDAYNPAIIYIEDVAFQRLIIQEARVQGLPVKGVRPEGDKISRSVMLQVRMEMGQVHLPRHKPYLSDIIDELAEFPNGSHDDIVDALSYVAIEANNLYRRIPAREVVLTAEERQEQGRAELERRMAEDEKRRQRAIYEGIL